MGTCENLGQCTPGAMVGSVCTTTHRGMPNQKGYCYTSDVGTLECGRMIAITPRFSTTPIPLKYGTGTSTPSRCAAGTPLTSPQTVTTKVLLVGGCMISTDEYYRSSAMIHVPAACKTPADLPAVQKGCVFPGARNYKPGAVQSDKCLYGLRGCMDLTALNYNSEATIP